MHMPSGADHWMLAANVLGCIMDATRWTARCSRSTFTSVRTMVTTWSVKLSRNPTVMIFKMICQAGQAGRQHELAVENGTQVMGTYGAMFPENDNALQDEQVRNADGYDCEHRAREDEVLASVGASVLRS